MIALVGNIIEDTVHIIKKFPKENQSNEVLLTYKQYGGIVNISRCLGLSGQQVDVFGTVGFDQSSINLKNHMPDYCNLNTTICTKSQTATATIIVNENKRSSLINWGVSRKIYFNTRKKYTWCHIAYFDTIENIDEIMPKIKKQCEFVSVDFCGAVQLEHLSKMTKYGIDAIICSTDNNKTNYNLKAYCKYFAVEHSSSAVRLNGKTVHVFKKSKNINVLGAGDRFAGHIIAMLTGFREHCFDFKKDFIALLKVETDIVRIIESAHELTLKYLKEQPYVN